MFTSFRQLLNFILIIALWTITLTPYAEYAQAAETNSNPAATKTYTASAAGDAKDAGEDDYVQQILQVTMMGWGLGLSVPSLSRKSACWEGAIAAVGSLLYLTGEGTLYKKIRGLESKINQYNEGVKHNKPGYIDDPQRAALGEVRTIYDELQKAAEKKKQFQEYAMMMYLIAGIIALVEAGTLFGNSLVCENRKNYPYELMQIFSNFSFTGALIPTAEASGIDSILEGMGVTGSLLAAVLVIATLSGVTLQVTMGPSGRAVIWFSMSAMALMAADETGDLADKLGTNVAEIDAILNAMPSVATGRPTNEVNTVATGGAFVQNVGQNVAKPAPTPTATPTAMVTTTNNCAVPASSGTGCMKVTIPTFDGIDLGETVSQSMQDGVDIANLNNANFGAGNIDVGCDVPPCAAAKRLKKNGPKLQAIANKLIDRYAKNVKDKKDSFNMRAAIKTQMKSMTDNTANELAKAGIDLSKATKVAMAVPQFDKKSGKFMMDTPFSMSSSPKIKAMKEEEKPLEVVEEAGDVKLTPPEGKNDFSEEQDRSIFSVISERYIQSAFPRFLRRKDSVK